MKQIELEELNSPAVLRCQRCGGLMRLIGSEPHPVEAKTDLLTYCCTACEKFRCCRSKTRQPPHSGFDVDVALSGLG